MIAERGNGGASILSRPRGWLLPQFERQTILQCAPRRLATRFPRRRTFANRLPPQDVRVQRPGLRRSWGPASFRDLSPLKKVRRSYIVHNISTSALREKIYLESS